jgi:hypothetical protein
MARKLESEAELRRRGVIDQRTDAYAKHEARPLTDHLNDFQAHLTAKGNTSKHAVLFSERARRVATVAKVDRLSATTTGPRSGPSLDGPGRMVVCETIPSSGSLASTPRKIVGTIAERFPSTN